MLLVNKYFLFKMACHFSLENEAAQSQKTVPSNSPITFEFQSTIY